MNIPQAKRKASLDVTDVVDHTYSADHVGEYRPDIGLPMAFGKSNNLKSGARRKRSKKFSRSFDYRCITWDSSQEDTSVQEIVEWAPVPPVEPVTLGHVDQMIMFGERKTSSKDETKFVDKLVLEKMRNAKNVFEELGDRDLRNARTRANPFEMVKSVFFQNRAAMKMANIDAILDFMLSSPHDAFGNTLVANDEQLFYFADICAGPGGFTEYMLWRHGCNAHGFGLTLRGPDDFKLDDFLASSPEMFEPFYGNSGVEGDGDITNPENLDNFINFIMLSTAGFGVHLIMGDGGFSVDGQEDLQEILSRRISLCQCACALAVLKPGGNFVCKLFDVFTLFSVSLVYLMYRCFDRISIHKPNTSRPANAERYIICKGFRALPSQPVKDHLLAVNRKFGDFQLPSTFGINSNCGSETDIESIIPESMIDEDFDFVQFITKSNNRLANRQALYLAKYKAYAMNPELYDEEQKSLRDEALRFWGIPDHPRRATTKPSPDHGLRELLKENSNWITNGHTSFDLRKIGNIFDYCLIPLSSKPMLVLSLGNTYIYQWEGSRWDVFSTHFVRLPRDTLLLAEIMQVVSGKKSSEKKLEVLRVLDAYFLNGTDIGSFPYCDRVQKISKFCRAIKCSSIPGLTEVVAPDFIYPEKLPGSVADRFQLKTIRGAERVVYLDHSELSYVVLDGVLWIKMVNDNWILSMSKKHGRTFYFNRKDGRSLFVPVEDSALGFVPTFNRRQFWPLKSSARLVMAKEPIEEILQWKDIIKFIQDKLPETPAASGANGGKCDKVSTDVERFIKKES